MGNYETIKCLSEVNDTDDKYVEALVKSMIEKGWQGAPILYTNLGLVTGSHRMEALNKIDEMYSNDEITEHQARVLDEVQIIDVTEEINDFCEKEDYCWDNLPLDDLSKIFEGTHVERFKDDIEEW